VSFAGFVLDRMPELARRLDQPDVAASLASRESVELDGRRMWISGGDRLIDEAEAKLEWALDHGLVDGAQLGRLQEEYGGGGEESDTIAVDV